RVQDVARSRTLGGALSVLGLVHLVAQAGNGGGRGTLLGFQLRGIQDGDQVAHSYLRAFVNQQFLDTPLDLRADDHLVGIHGADQHEIAAVVGREPVVGQRDQRDDAKEDEYSAAGAHLRSPSALGLALRNRAEEHTSELQSRENLVCRLLLEKKNKFPSCCA